jgi:hypothetical protein
MDNNSQGKGRRPGENGKTALKARLTRIIRTAGL